MRTLPPVLALVTFATTASAQAPEWDLARARAILDQAAELRLAPALSDLRPGERTAVGKLLEAGALMQALYEQQRHPQALAAKAALEARHAQAPTELTRALRDLYRLNQGPIAVTLDNRREPFLAVAPQAPERNVYPAGATAEALEAFAQAHPERRAELFDTRSVVRRADAASIAADLAALDRHPVLDGLHPGLRARLQALPRDGGFYAVPQAVAHADELVAAHRLLREAAEAVADEDPEFAGYLRHRGRDLLANDYEAGDAAWVSGHFRNLNAQVGSYETYDDALFGVKAFFSLSLLKKDAERSAAVAKAVAGLQAIQDALPAPPRRVREEIPVGVYDVIADFGQARGTNTATILPNEAVHARRYGRVILLRRNVMTAAPILDAQLAAFRAATVPAHHGELHGDAEFQRTLWHEVGHYLGVDRTADGRDLDAALQGAADLLEEMKADLVSLFAGPALRARGYHDDAALKALYAAGVRRTLQNNRPRRDQPYQTMQLMQQNFFLEHGLLAWEGDALAIRHERYPAVVAALLKEVLAVQHAGDRARAEAFVARWTGWSERHEALAAKLRAAGGPRFRLVRYGALGE
jgi:hypothetical protein